MTRDTTVAGAVTRVAQIGVTGWCLLLLAAVLVLRPMVARTAAIVPGVAVAVHRAATRVRFRAERRWRVQATQDLLDRGVLAGVEEQALGVVAGRLCRVRSRIDAENRLPVGTVATVPARGFLRRPIGLAVLSADMLAGVAVLDMAS